WRKARFDRLPILSPVHSLNLFSHPNNKPQVFKERITMKLGLGLYRYMLTRDNFKFARQAGATHIVAHLVDYFNNPASLSTGSGGAVWGVSDNRNKLWTYEELRDLRAAVNAEGLELEAIEN